MRLEVYRNLFSSWRNCDAMLDESARPATVGGRAALAAGKMLLLTAPKGRPRALR